MTTTIHGAAYDLEVVRLIRQRILAGDWTQGRAKDEHGHCLTAHLLDIDRSCTAFWVTHEAVDADEGDYLDVADWNDTHSQAEVVALLDDVEDSLLGELGVAG